MLAARHRARLAMQDDNGDVREAFTRRYLTNGNVRRRLFVDEDENEGQDNRQGLYENRTNALFEEARNNIEQAKERWNFDFENEIPLPGNYVWVKLDKDGKEVPVSDSHKQKEEEEEEEEEEVSENTRDKEECKVTRVERNEKLEDK